MSESLSQKKCIPCRGGTPPLEWESISAFLEKLNHEKFKETPLQYEDQSTEWIVERNKGYSYDYFYLIRNYKFSDFKQALGFVEAISKKAEEEGHHPDITFGWGYCMIKLWTHKIKGLTESDFYMAAKIESIFQNKEGF